MATNLNIDEQLLLKALKIGGKKTKRETVNEALLEYIHSRQQKKVIILLGKVDFQPGYDYKRSRKER